MHRLLPLLSTVLLSILPACGRGNIALHAAPRPAAQVVVGAKAPLEADAGPAPHETAPLARVAGGGHPAPLVAAPSGKRAGKRIAVLVGVGQYALLNDLTMPTKDTEDLKRTLEQIGFECRVIHDQADLQPVDVATIEAELARYALSTDPEDTFLFYFSGHGFSLSLGGRNADFVCPRSANPSDPSTSLSIDRVRTILTDPGCKAASRIVILDACRNVAGPADPALRSQLLFGEGSFASLDRAGLTVLSSTSPGHVSLELARGTLDNDGAEISNGLFTHFLMKAFSTVADENRDGLLTFRELGQHVARSMLDFSLRNNHRYQIPYWDAQMQRTDIVLCNVGAGTEGQEHEAYALVQQAARMPSRQQIIEFLKNKVLGSYHTDAEFRKACDKAISRTLADGLSMRTKLANTHEAMLGIIEFCLGVDAMGENCIRSLAVGLTPEDLETRIIFLHAVATIDGVHPDAHRWIDALLAPCVRMGVQHQKWPALEAIFAARAFRCREACMDELQRSLQRLAVMSRPSDVNRLLAAFADDGLMPPYGDVRKAKNWDLVAAHLALRARDAAGLVGEDRAQAQDAVAAEMQQVFDGELAAAELAEALSGANAVLAQFARREPLAVAHAALLDQARPALWARVEAAAAGVGDKAAVDRLLACRDLALAFAGTEEGWRKLVGRHRDGWLALSLAALAEGKDVDPSHLLQIREFAVDDAGRAKASARLRALALASLGDPARSGAAFQAFEAAMTFGLTRECVVADLFTLPEGVMDAGNRKAWTRHLLAFAGRFGMESDLHEACLRLVNGALADRDLVSLDELLPLAREAAGAAARVRSAMDVLVRVDVDAPERGATILFLAEALDRCARMLPARRLAPDLRLLPLRSTVADAMELDAVTKLVLLSHANGAGVEELATAVAWCARQATLLLQSGRLVPFVPFVGLDAIARKASCEELGTLLATPAPERAVPIAAFALELHALFCRGTAGGADFPADSVRTLLATIVEVADPDRADALLRGFGDCGIAAGDFARASWTRLVIRTARDDASLGTRIEALRSYCDKGILPKEAVPRAFEYFRGRRDWDAAHALLVLREDLAASPDGILVRDIVALRDQFRELAATREQSRQQVVIEKRATSARNNRRITVRSHVDVDSVDGFRVGGAITEELRGKGRLLAEVGEQLRLQTDGRQDMSMPGDVFPLVAARLRCGIKVLRAQPVRDGELSVQVTVALPDRDVVPLDSFSCSSGFFRRALSHGDDVPRMASGDEFEWPLVVDDKQPLVFSLGGFPLQGNWELVAELHLDPALTAANLQKWSDAQRRTLAKDPNSVRKAVLKVQFGNGTEQVLVLQADGKPLTIRVAVPTGAGSLTLQGSGDWPGRNFVVLEGARLVRTQ